MPKRKSRPVPEPGTIRKRVYKGESYTMEVVEDGGKIGYRVKDIVYPSPSAAAKSITKTEVNGWLFWRLES